MAVEVPLTRGAVALIDEEDADRVLAHRWRLIHQGRLCYAGRGSTIYLHRFLTDAPRGREVDHINGDGLDNRRSNLRIVSHSENLHNPHGVSPARSGVRNVYRAGGRWFGAFWVDRRRVYLGCFDTVEDAAAAVEAKRRALGLLPVEVGA